MSSSVDGQNTTVSSGSVDGQNTIVSSGSVDGQNITMSSGFVGGQNTTVSSGSVDGQNITMSSGSVGQNITMSSGSVDGQNTTVSSGSVGGQNITLSSGSVDGQNKSMSSSVGGQNTTVSSGSVGQNITMSSDSVGQNITMSSGSVDGQNITMSSGSVGQNKSMSSGSVDGQNKAMSSGSLLEQNKAMSSFVDGKNMALSSGSVGGQNKAKLRGSVGRKNKVPLRRSVVGKNLTSLSGSVGGQNKTSLGGSVLGQIKALSSGSVGGQNKVLLIGSIETHKTLHEFTSQKEFLAWKGSLEMDVGVNYTAHAGSWHTGEGIKQIFYCRRSGVKPSSQDISKKKRAEKKQGTSKLGLYCTSSMEVLKADGKIRVTLYTDHHDHELGSPNLVHMVLPRSEKDKIAGMITQGIERYKILEQVRKASGENRTSIMERKDIENIIAEYGLNESQSRHTDCQVCKCMYICSCDDNAAERKDMCEHIHTVVGYLKNNPRPRKRKSPKDNVCNEESTGKQAEEYKDKLKRRMHLLLSKCDEMEDLETMKALDKYLSKAFGIIDAKDTYHSHSVNLPLDENVEKQDNPTKKRKRKDEGKSLNKPCVKAAGQENGETKCAKSPSDIRSPSLTKDGIDNEHSYTVSEFAII
ncbi:hypothetical protein Pcinc_004875 [Petrolisthes cinctipes]|uniref:Uncharacterized protein n=1 Tax=Petrolisthes cinctipes TaxID=88211 RepID=A0AAE1L3B7_PETCI|nr:hypothetical protein Pcinc_004875 [Petrolisthes cinctipes]